MTREGQLTCRKTKKRNVTEILKQVQTKIQKLIDEKRQALRDLKAMQNRNIELTRQIKQMEERIAELEKKQIWDICVDENAENNFESNNIQLDMDEVKMTEIDLLLNGYLNNLAETSKN
ncbi:7800_t:CDS:2 [Paraglomus occultum]|uniref:7800_t:CDS:1 n=1 Tax=Paraglomus occultum TaxID=144539 RepID=A0A9N9FXW7_9GLOM|nr:7800_t:CDS:2 [Paraglomus occultum]